MPAPDADPGDREPAVPPVDLETEGRDAGRRRDPLAVAIANASLLGVGYLMLRRRRLAVTAVVVTALLLVVNLLSRSGWFQFVVLAWWLALVAHGWYLAGWRAHRARPAVATAHEGSPRPARSPQPGRQRLVAVGVAIPVLATFAVFRVDAATTENAAARAHRAGECDRALSTLAELSFGHRLADAPLAGRAEDSAEACQLLVRTMREAEQDRIRAAATARRYAAHPAALWPEGVDLEANLVLAQAAEELVAALGGDVDAVDAGFGHLATALEQFPDRAADTGAVLERFLAALPAQDPCDTAAVTDWLGDRSTRGDHLDRAIDVVGRVAPEAIVGCGDEQLRSGNATRARQRYRQLIADYPDHDLADRAEAGVARATEAIQLKKVRTLLQRPFTNGKPDYCRNPAPYRAAEPYRGNGPHRMLLYGQNGHKGKLPAAWRAHGARDAVLVVCAGQSRFGATVRTCTYEPLSSTAIPYVSVTFHKRTVPVRVYELRTGRLVTRTSVRIGGTACPPVVSYSTHITDLGPPSTMYIRSSTADIRAAYAPLVRP